MKCPSCSDLLEEKGLLGKPVGVDVCRGCKGMWFDRGELTFMLDGKEQPPRVTAGEIKAPMCCPRCGAALSDWYYPGTFIVVDRCLACEGLWLDGGELAEIRAARKEADLQRRLEEAKKAPPGGLKGKALDFVNAALKATWDW